MKKINVKEVINNDNWIITCIRQGRDGIVRVDARTRYWVCDGINMFSDWYSIGYIDRLLLDKYGKKHKDMKCYMY